MQVSLAVTVALGIGRPSKRAGKRRLCQGAGRTGIQWSSVIRADTPAGKLPLATLLTR